MIIIDNRVSIQETIDNPDIPALIDFFEEVPEYDSAMYCHKKMKTNEETSLTVLKEVLPVLPCVALNRPLQFRIILHCIFKFPNKRSVTCFRYL